jgi:lycopene beta-cyclase
MATTLTAAWWDRRVTDVLVAGGGPAGWAVADQCARHGLRTVLVDPRPGAPWRATYGMWRDECALLPSGSTWVEASATWACGRRLARGYAVLDNESVRTAVANPDVRVIAGEVGSVRAGMVTLTSGRVLATTVVVDATGPPPGRGPAAEQTAFGVVLPAEVAAPLVAPGEAVFMDWRGGDGRTFLYAVPLTGGRVLVEETSLARRPAMDTAELRTRLLIRLATHGVSPGRETETVRIRLDLPVPRRRAGVVPFGAAAAMVHPATGYSVAESFRLAPRVADAIARGRDAAAWRVLWSPSARVVHGLRGRGLAVVLGLDTGLPEFFDVFFDLSPESQRRYLSEREDVGGTVAAMGALFWRADWRLRGRIARTALIV